MKIAVRLFALNFVQFCIIAANMRAIAQANYAASFITDTLCGLIAFTLTKWVVDAKTKTQRIAYALGGAVGAQVAIYITKQLFGA